MMKLYSFSNNSVSYRVCIALVLKGLGYRMVGVSTRIGQQNELAYRRMNPVRLMPTLVTGDEGSPGQSLIIIDQLDGHFPQAPLLPADFSMRNKILEIVYAVACDIHPVNSMRVPYCLSGELKVSEEDKKHWYTHWVQQGLSVVEQMLCQSHSGKLRVGDASTLADCRLIPQWANAPCMGCDLNGYPRCKAVYDACTQFPALITAVLENQQDKTPA